MNKKKIEAISICDETKYGLNIARACVLYINFGNMCDGAEKLMYGRSYVREQLHIFNIRFFLLIFFFFFDCDYEATLLLHSNGNQTHTINLIYYISFLN